MIEVPFSHEFLGGVLIEHQRVHWLFGQENDNCVSCHMATGYSPDDPIFMLLHSFVAYLRAIWAGCHGTLYPLLFVFLNTDNLRDETSYNVITPNIQIPNFSKEQIH